MLTFKSQRTNWFYIFVVVGIATIAGLIMVLDQKTSEISVKLLEVRVKREVMQEGATKQAIPSTTGDFEDK